MTAPNFRHNGCPIAHKTQATMARCAGGTGSSRKSGAAVGRYVSSAGVSTVNVGEETWDRERLQKVETYASDMDEAAHSRTIAIQNAAREYRKETAALPDDEPLPPEPRSGYARAYATAQREYSRASVAARVKANMPEVDLDAATRLLGQDMSPNPGYGMIPVRVTADAPMLLASLSEGEISNYYRGLVGIPEPAGTSPDEQAAYRTAEALRTKQGTFGVKPLHRNTVADVILIDKANGSMIERRVNEIRRTDNGRWVADAVAKDDPEMIRTGKTSAGMYQTVEFGRLDVMGWKTAGEPSDLPDHRPIVRGPFRTPASGEMGWPAERFGAPSSPRLGNRKP